ncbi:hypothetical protein [Actinomadura alba]|uniref:Uncharacterized protein n=1 Tax=Actinomadura alba TaxID=406431 RepID=A0ABR7M3Q1_9ACTN|nr:hypothetical protein [Actinomadura alba]MBC6471208.1 hypothetical protein [Actinomadura alba]
MATTEAKTDAVVAKSGKTAQGGEAADAPHPQTATSDSARANRRIGRERRIHRNRPQANRLTFRDVRDLTSRNGVLVRCFLDPTTEPEQAAERLREIWGVGVDLEVRLRRPLGSLLRGWITRLGAKAAAEGARLLSERPN